MGLIPSWGTKIVHAMEQLNPQPQLERHELQKKIPMTQHRYLVPAATKTRGSQIEKKGNNSFTHCYRHRMEEFQIINTDFRHTRSSLREVSPTHSPALSTISPCFTLLPKTYHRLTSCMFYCCKQTFLPLSISLSHMSE